MKQSTINIFCEGKILIINYKLLHTRHSLQFQYYETNIFFGTKNLYLLRNR